MLVSRPLGVPGDDDADIVCAFRELQCGICHKVLGGKGIAKNICRHHSFQVVRMLLKIIPECDLQHFICYVIQCCDFLRYADAGIHIALKSRHRGTMFEHNRANFHDMIPIRIQSGGFRIKSNIALQQFPFCFRIWKNPICRRCAIFDFFYCSHVCHWLKSPVLLLPGFPDIRRISDSSLPAVPDN